MGGITMSHIQKPELAVLEILWEEGGVTAKELMSQLNETLSWSQTMTLQIIRRCIMKGWVERKPGRKSFICRAIISQEEMLARSTEFVTDQHGDVLSDLLIASLLGRDQIKASQLDALRHLVGEFDYQ